MTYQTGSNASNRSQLHYSSILADADGSVIASPLGSTCGIERRRGNGRTEWLKNGWPEGATVNRLQWARQALCACTDQGLFVWNETESRWMATDIVVPCYRLKEEGGCCYAATQYGVWCHSGSGWASCEWGCDPVYDLLLTPEYTILGDAEGLALYDRYASAWARFSVGSAVTGLSVIDGYVVAVSGQGDLIVGDKRGSFDAIRFDTMSIFLLCEDNDCLYACTSRGLFRVAVVRGQIRMLSVQLGFPVTDVAVSGETLHLATLFQGLQTAKA